MEGENNGSKPYEQMDDLGGFPPIFGSTPNMFLNGQKAGIFMRQNCDGIPTPETEGSTFSELQL